MKFKKLIAAAILATAMPFAASAITVFPTGFGAVFDAPGADEFAVITVESGDIQSFATPGFVDLIFDVTAPLDLFAKFAFTPPGPVGIGVDTTPFVGAQAFFIENPDARVHTPTTGGPVTGSEVGLASTTLTESGGVQVGLSLLGQGFSPNPGAITPGGGDNYALRIVWDDLLEAGNLTVTMTPVAVPLPASILFFVSGLGGLIALNRRKKCIV